MELKKVWAVYYSATGTTAKVVRTAAEALAERLGLPMEERSFTRPVERAAALAFTAADLVVVGSPTYAGKLPNKILPDFQEKLRGNGALAVPVVLFGNRSFDNSLAELRTVLESGGFRPIAAGAFVGRHAFTDELAFGRPGWSDMAEIREFAGKIAEKALSGDSSRPSPGQTCPGAAAAGPASGPAPWGRLIRKTWRRFQGHVSSARAACASAPGGRRTLMIRRFCPTWPCWSGSSGSRRRIESFCKRRGRTQKRPAR